MLNKKFFILIGVFVSLLIMYFIFNERNKQESIEPSLIIENEGESINQENIEEAKLLFIEVEEGFYNILENIFLMGDDVTRLLAEEIVEIENNLKNVREGLDKGDISSKELYESLSTIQIKVQSLTEKLIEINS